MTAVQPAPAPVDPDAVEAALRPHGESLMLPAEAYTSADVLAWEQRELFAGQWTCVGRAAELFDGDTTQHALRAGDVGVLLTRTDDGAIRGFANVCRHRGHELLPDGGNSTRPAAVCPYHGWAYTLGGELRTAPGMREFTAFDSSEFGLVEVAVEAWEGWLFVNARGGAAPFGDYVGGMAGLVAPYRPAGLELGARHTYDVAANWKVVVENYHECYHCPLIHPELCKVSPPSSGDNWNLPGAWVGGLMELRPHAETMSLDGKSRGKLLPGVDPRTVSYLGLFPNLLVSLHPDYVMTHRMTALDPNRTSIECSWYVPAGVTDPSYAVDFWDITNREDWAACESVQRGLNSPHYRSGPLAPNEDAVYQWVTLIARAYQGKDILTRQAASARTR